MSKRIYYSTWGKLGGFSGYAIKRNYEESLSAVCRAITRMTKLSIAGGPCSQGYELENNKVVARDYSASLGKSAGFKFGDGYNVHGEIWFRVKVEGS